MDSRRISKDDSYLFVWISMDSQFLWISEEFQEFLIGSLWIPLVFVWIPTKFLWIPIESYRMAMDSCGCLWTPMNSCGIPMDS